ncbi:MAG: RNA recognition motif domain-containing protein [Myxococcota bacterium]
MKRLYVGNLPWRCTEDELRDHFAAFGPVQSVAIITDRETGRSRGFGFVEMEDEGASTAIAEGDGRDFGGRPLRVSEARERERRGPGGPGPRGGGGYARG